MYSPSERRVNAIIILASMALMVVAIHTIFNPPHNVRLNESVQGIVMEKYVTIGQALYFGLKEDSYDGETQVEVTKEEFEKYNIGDYFVRVK